MAFGLFSSLLRFRLDITFDSQKNQNTSHQIVNVGKGAVVNGDISLRNDAIQVIDGAASDSSARIIEGVSRQFNNNSQLIRDFYLAVGVEYSRVSLGKLDKNDICNIALFQQHIHTEIPLLVQKLNRVAKEILVFSKAQSDFKKVVKQFKECGDFKIFTKNEFKSLFDATLISRTLLAEKEMLVSRVSSIALKEMSDLTALELNCLFEVSKKAYAIDREYIIAQSLLTEFLNLSKESVEKKPVPVRECSSGFIGRTPVVAEIPSYASLHSKTAMTASSKSGLRVTKKESEIIFSAPVLKKTEGFETACLKLSKFIKFYA